MKRILKKLNIWTSLPMLTWPSSLLSASFSSKTAAISEPIINSHILRRPASHLAASWLFWTPFPKWTFSYWNKHLLWNWIWLLCLLCFARYTICYLTGCLVVKLNQTILLLTKKAQFTMKKFGWCSWDSLAFAPKAISLMKYWKGFLKTQ